MQDYPTQHRLEFDMEFTKAINRFTKDFSEEFVNDGGEIDWEKLTKSNSGIETVGRSARSSQTVNEQTL